MSDDDYEDIDVLPRSELAEFAGPAYTVACVLEDWSRQHNGVISGNHGAGLFLDLLAAEGYQVTPIGPLPSLDELLPPPAE